MARSGSVERRALHALGLEARLAQKAAERDPRMLAVEPKTAEDEKPYAMDGTTAVIPLIGALLRMPLDAVIAQQVAEDVAETIRGRG